MTIRKTAAHCTLLALALGTVGSAAHAQDAAETAVILSGTSSGQAKAQQSLGSAVRGSINGAAATIRTTPRRGGRAAVRPRGRAGASQIGALPANQDPLENTNASAYKLGNGAVIRVSGRLNPAAGTNCTKNCTPAVSTDNQPSAVVDDRGPSAPDPE